MKSGILDETHDFGQTKNDILDDIFVVSLVLSVLLTFVAVMV